MMLRAAFACVALLALAPLHAQPAARMHGTVFHDRDGNGVRGRSEAGIAQVLVSNGRDVVASDAKGDYVIGVQPGDTVFAIKPAQWRFGQRTDGLPAFWQHYQPVAAPALKYGGLPLQTDTRFDIALQPQPKRKAAGEYLIFGDPQPKSLVDVDYYARDIVRPLMGQTCALLGVSLGDIVNDDLSLYPAMNAVTRKLGVPWLHAPGNHDMDFDAPDDARATDTFRASFGPANLAWEEHDATFLVLDDVIHQPGQRPAYTGGFREDQLQWLEALLPRLRRDRLLVVALHIPLFEAPGRDTFRDADRARLFALLGKFPQVLVLSAHLHTQQHFFHGAESGWRAAQPLHEYNVGAACGAFWSGAKDGEGIPDATMADGTPNGHALLRVGGVHGYTLQYVPARGRPHADIGLHAPKVLRRGAYPAFGVYANVWMGMADTPVEYRVDGGPWKPMTRVLQPDPTLLAENARDDAANTLRSYDRSPEAESSQHLWRGTLPTDLSAGEHRVEVRAQDRWRGAVRAETSYRLEDAQP